MDELNHQFNFFPHLGSAFFRFCSWDGFKFFDLIEVVVVSGYYRFYIWKISKADQSVIFITMYFYHLDK